VRDGLSILDQAIAHADLGGDGQVSAVQVQDMLGLADKSAQRRLFAALLEGDGAALLDAVDQQFALGVEPLALLRGAMELAHRIAVAQLGRSAADAVSAEERAALEDWAQRLTPAQVHRLWQLLLKGYDEVRGAPDPLVAAKMALLRVLHAADMPDPGTLARKLDDLAANGVVVGAASAATPAAAPAARAEAGWSALIEQVDQSGQLRLAQVMRDWVRVIELKGEELLYTLAPGYAGDPTAELRDALLRATGQRWQVTRGEGEGQPTLRELAEAAKQAEHAALMQHPLVEAAFAAFPEAQIMEETPDARVAQGGNKWSR
jgi:DNA polymerase-3 subunit gamma/tau